MLTSVAHTAICVANVDDAVRWYTDVLGLRILAGPNTLTGPEIERDMAEVIPDVRPVVVRAAILGLEHGDRVLEIIEYPTATPPPPPEDHRMTDPGLSHIGLVCDDLAATRADLESKGVRFITSGTAGIVGLQTTWFADPFGVAFILMEKGRRGDPYYRQFSARRS